MIEGDWPMIQMEILERLVRFWFIAGLFAGIFVVLVGMRITRRIIKKRAERQAKAKKSWEEVVERVDKELSTKTQRLPETDEEIFKFITGEEWLPEEVYQDD